MGNKPSVQYYPGQGPYSSIDNNKKRKKLKKSKMYHIPPNATRPSPPSKPNAVIESDGIFLYWEDNHEQGSSGGCPIIGYQIEYKTSQTPSIWTSSPLSSTSPECLIQNLVPGSSYIFRVLAENILGYSAPSPESDTIVFTNVNEPMEPKFITGLKNEYFGIIGEKITFKVQVLSKPTSFLSWYLNDDQLIEEFNENIEIGAAQLIIKRITEDMEGELRCVAVNDIGTAETHGNLIVGIPPKIIETHHRESSPDNASSKISEYSIDCQHLLFQVGEMARIRFKFSGKPEPILTWFHDGNELKNLSNNEWTIETLPGLTVLKIHSVSRSNRGEYSVKVENSFGSDIGFVLVTIGDVPSPPRQPTVLVLKDNSVVLEWDAGEDDGGCDLGSYSVEYFRSGWDVWLTGFRTKNSTINSGRIRDLIPGSKYKFRVKSENPYGVSEPSLESVEILIPDYNKESGELMSPLEEDEEFGEEFVGTGVNQYEIGDGLKISDDKPPKSRITKKFSPSPVLKRKQFDSVPVPAVVTPTSSTSSSRNFLSTPPPPKPKRFSPTESNNSPTSSTLLPSTYETYMSPHKNQLLSKPWNAKKDNKFKTSSTHSLPRTSVQHPNNLSPLTKRPASASLETFSPNLIYEGSRDDNDSFESDFLLRGNSSDEEESSLTVTTSFLTVLKSGSIELSSSSRTASKEELVKKSRESPRSGSSLQGEEEKVEPEINEGDYFSKIFGNKRSFISSSTQKSDNNYDWFHVSTSNNARKVVDDEHEASENETKDDFVDDNDDDAGIRVYPSSSDDDGDICDEECSTTNAGINRKLFAASVLFTGVLLKYPLYTSYGIMVYVTYKLGKVLFWDKEEEKEVRN